MNIRKDMLNQIPSVGDLIAYNPPYVKGIVIARVLGFAKSGLPKVIDIEDIEESLKECNEENGDIINYCDTPKTGFVVVQKENYQIY